MEKLEIFAGPCVLENEELALQVANFLVKELEPLKQSIALTFKGSFDKANRSSIESYRGPGMEEGLRIMEKVKRETGLPVVTDFHSPDQARPLAEVIDTLQLPAFLCRQTDMVVAGAKACKERNRRLKIKKGQFVSPLEVENIVNKASSLLDKEQILMTERGYAFGYQNLVVDMASFQVMQSFGVKTVHDATHCVQKPGGMGKTSGGKRDQIEVLANAAVAAGADGVFLECHPHPENSKSDASTSLPLESVPALIKKWIRIKQAIEGQ